VAVFVGLISYSAYLWHQPLFALARYASLTGEIGTPLALALSAMTLLLAAGTWRYVETPFRDRRRVSNPALAWACAIGLLAVATPAALLAFGGVGGRRSPTATNIVGQSALALFTDCNPTLQPTRRLGAGCLLDPSSAAPPSFVVVGDSHADLLYPAFARLSRDTGQQGRLLQHSNCSPLLDVEGASPSAPGCQAMRDEALALVEAHGLDRAVLVSRFAHEYVPHEFFARRFEKTVSAYAQRGARVYVVLQAPEQPRFDRRDYTRAVLQHRFFGIDAAPAIRRMSVSRAEHERTQAFVNAVFASYQHDPRVRFVDFTPVLCDETTCAVGTASALYYYDDDHLNATGALLVSGAITTQLKAR
jgi:hypothetical protein